MRFSSLLVIVSAILLANTSLARANGGYNDPPSVSCAPPSLNTSAALAGGLVTVSPAPQSRDASADAQISFLGVPAGDLSNVTVTGSRSGAHAGQLAPYSQGDGASFLPAKPFNEEELVSVRATLNQEGRQTPFSWSFTVSSADTAHVAGAGTPIPPSKSSYYQHFASRPDLQPPVVTVTADSPSSGPGELFLAPYSGPGQYGPMILSEHGQLIWFKPLPGRDRAADLRVQSYEGKPVLTWWQDPLLIDGKSTAGIVIDNSSYEQIATVGAGNGYQADLHEFQITPQGTALITIYNAIKCDLASIEGPKNGGLVDAITQEIDLKTGLVMFEWHSLDHVALTDSYSSARPTSLKTPFDFFHINSVDVEPDGNLLIDARDTWALYDVNAKTGQVVWTLGGKHSSFTMGPGTKTAFQHDARRQPNGEITFFDNGANPAVHPQSRAIEERLDMQNMTVTLTHRYEHNPSLLAGSQGNMQALSNENWMVGWGEVPYFTEFSHSGAVLFDANLPNGYENYRAFRFPWSGQPHSRPAVVVKAQGHHQVIDVSWNGATQVADWRVLAGSSTQSLKPLVTVSRAGFETTVPISGSARYVLVQALDSGGAVIGASPTLKT